MKSFIRVFGEFVDEFGIVVVVVLLFFAFIFGLASCAIDKEPTKEDNNSNFYIHTVGKHEYIVYHNYSAGGLCHKEDCKFCEEKK